MTRTLLAILLSSRHKSAVAVQKLLTEYGCFIKTRLGLHEGVLDCCSDAGLIILELAGPAARTKRLAKELNALPKVAAKLVTVSLKDK